MNSIADILDAAADVIERDGWTQGHFHDDAGAHCALGAVSVATGTSYEGVSAYLVAGWALSEYLGISAVPSWNDAKGRTAEEVVASLRACALTYRARAAETPAELPLAVAV